VINNIGAGKDFRCLTLANGTFPILLIFLHYRLIICNHCGAHLWWPHNIPLPEAV